MELRKSISIQKSGHIEQIKTVFYETFPQEDYKELFESVKESGIILNENFNDSIWSVFYELNQRIYHLKFDFEVYTPLHNGVKSYILLLLFQGYAANYCNNVFVRIRNAILNSRGFSSTESLQKYIVTLNEVDKYRLYARVTDFFRFYDHPNKNSIIKICKSPRKVNENRDLPDFNDVLIFDDIIKDYFSLESKINIKYLPIQIWWELTNIIPLRPIEFYNLKFDCVTNTKGRYILSLPREKDPDKKRRRAGIDVLREVDIDKKTYDMIINFQNISIDLNIKSSFLCSYDFHYYFFTKKYVSDALRHEVKSSLLESHHFQYLLDDFYQEVVSEKYMFGEIERITIGDTRHFAIINLYLQGYNILSIARLAGQNDLQTPSNYFNHATFYAQSKVSALAKKELESKISEKMSESYIGEKRQMIDKGRIYPQNSLDLLRKVEFGYCEDISNDFPINCEEDCRVCEKFIFKPSINDYEKGVQWLEKYYEKNQEELNDIISYMAYLHEKIIIDVKNSLVQKSANDDLIQKSRRLTSLMNQQVKVRSLIMEMESDE